MNRRLAAILVADVVGYSSLMEADEAGTLAALKQRRSTILEPIVRSHSGRVVKFMGDGVLVEFLSAVNAVKAGLELQAKFSEANAILAEDRQIILRIGINLGEVIGEGTDIYGEGVNVATRLESMAEPGTVCISETMYHQVNKKLAYNYVDLGHQQLKNIADPVHVFQIDSTTQAGSSLNVKRKRDERPSIAILPFNNISGDQEQQYLSDGITEDIITELSRFHSLLVIARNSSFHFRGPAIDLNEVRRKLGVRYILEGSLRKLGSTVRITAQLIDAATGTHLWAERYDRELRDIFALQDEVVATIVATIEGRAATTGLAQVRRTPLKNWAAYDFYLQGRDNIMQYKMDEAGSLFAQSIELDPTFAQAHAWRAITLVGRYWYDNDLAILASAKTFAQKAVSLDPSDALGHNAIGLVLLHMHQHAEAGIYLDRARTLNPLEVNILGDYANWLNYGGKPEEALRILDKVLLRDPLPPVWIWEIKGTALYLLKRYSEAISSYRKVGGEHYFIHAFLAAAYAFDEQVEFARSEVAEALKILPDLTIAGMSGSTGFPFDHKPSLEHFLAGFRRAGFPE